MSLQRLGERIRAIRKDKGYSQEQLAEKANTHVNYVSAVERGEKNVTFESIEKIAEALNISFAELFRFVDTNGKEDEVGQLVNALYKLPLADRQFVINNAKTLMKWKHNK
ncbi:helix-turn-helix domain-containing protein [Paenibacillus protaetiae]|uniref:XRE family transcriptional regulator n=1 Tax=Paenibacillus protaetiae TaxID=2509456 RepID=A0A4P6ETV1_9BACL|nr:helix-turn-helix transcriptional regulator [Paenibacillus protaetiae]QAY66362.1 XRE family transcriptional regulator [Paenibacillus protaetiae]